MKHRYVNKLVWMTRICINKREYQDVNVSLCVKHEKWEMLVDRQPDHPLILIGLSVKSFSNRRQTTRTWATENMTDFVLEAPSIRTTMFLKRLVTRVWSCVWMIYSRFSYKEENDWNESSTHVPKRPMEGGHPMCPSLPTTASSLVSISIFDLFISNSHVAP